MPVEGQAPRLTVIIRLYNDEATIGRALASCHLQTEKVQVVIVDDGSTDQWADSAEGALFANVKIIRHAENLGTAAAMNSGIAACSTEYVGFLDADDVLEPTFAEKMVRVLDSNPSYGLAYCRVVNGPKWELEGKEIFPSVLRQGYLCPPGVLVVRREALETIPRIPTRDEIGIASDVCEDDRLCFELCRFNSVLHLREELYRSIGAPGQVTSDYLKWAAGWDRLIEDYKPEIVVHLGFGPLFFHIGRVSSFHIRAGSSLKYAFSRARALGPDGSHLWWRFAVHFAHGYLLEATLVPRRRLRRVVRQLLKFGPL